MTRLLDVRVRRMVIALALGALILYPVVFSQAVYWQTVLLLAFLLGTMALSWTIISGLAGYISLGHSAFLGIGSYTVAILALRLHVNPLYFVVVAGLAAAVTALLIGALVLRTRGPSFVIITIAFLFALQICASNFTSVTEGAGGITLRLPFWSVKYQNVPFYYMFLGLMVLTFAFAWWIRRTKFGTGLMAIREDEGKAAAIGVNTTAYKILAYMASAVLIGAAGGVYAYFLSFVNPLGAFNLLTSVTIVLACLVGGKGSIWGALLGAFIVQFGMEFAVVQAGDTESRLLILGLSLVVVVLFLPHGLLPTVQTWWRERQAAATAVEFIDHTGAMERRSITLTTRAASVADRDSAASPLLDVRGAVRTFGGIRAVDGVDLAVRKGSIAGLIGPNGSGKTTLFNVVTGAMKMGDGEVRFDGQRIDHLPPWSRAHLGLGRTFQVTRLFASMTVLENVVAPLPSFRWRRLGADAVSGPEAQRAKELLGFVGMERFADQVSGALSYGQQKLVELAQVLMLEPKMILLDEPAGGINPGLVNRMVEIIRDLNSQGITFIVVEHNIPLVMDLCDTVTVLSRGKVISQGTPAQVRADPEVLEAYLGPEWVTAPEGVAHPEEVS